MLFFFSLSQCLCLLFFEVQPSVPPKYFLTFQGIRNQGLDGASYVRGNLEATLNASKNAPQTVRLPNGEARPVENITRLPNDVYIAIASKAQRHHELRPGERKSIAI